MATYTVTCHTVGCENAEQAIVLELGLPPGVFTCGACGLPIEDVDGP